MPKIELNDSKIIELLEKVLENKTLDSWFIDMAQECIRRLKNGTVEEKERARMAARPIISKYENFVSQEQSNYCSTNNKELLDRVARYVQEIRMFLDTKDLNPDLAMCLQITLETLTKEGASVEELSRDCVSYEQRLRLPAKLSSDLPPERRTKK